MLNIYKAELARVGAYFLTCEEFFSLYPFLGGDISMPCISEAEFLRVMSYSCNLLVSWEKFRSNGSSTPILQNFPLVMVIFLGHYVVPSLIYLPRLFCGCILKIIQSGRSLDIKWYRNSMVIPSIDCYSQTSSLYQTIKKSWLSATVVNNISKGGCLLNKRRQQVQELYSNRSCKL